MLRSIGWVLGATLLFASIVPVASGNHCDTKITIYGRISPAPLAPPPYSSTTAGICVRVYGQTGAEEHKLPPNTNQVMVRVNGDFGVSIQTLDVELDGLGFVDIHHTLYRTANPAGGFTYDLPDWVSLPGGPVDGELTATITQPGGLKRSVTYTTTATVVAPPLPPPP